MRFILDARRLFRYAEYAIVHAKHAGRPILSRCFALLAKGWDSIHYSLRLSPYAACHHLSELLSNQKSFHWRRLQVTLSAS